MASDAGRASTRVPAERHGSVALAHAVPCTLQLRTPRRHQPIDPRLLDCVVSTEPTLAFKIVASQKGIGTRVCASPSHSFASSLESIELRASGKGPPPATQSRVGGTLTAVKEAHLRKAS